MFAEWLFNAHHHFEFRPFGDVGENGETKACNFVHGEEFGGILAFLMSFLIGGMTERRFIKMNNGLKERAEADVKRGVVSYQ